MLPGRQKRKESKKKEMGNWLCPEVGEREEIHTMYHGSPVKIDGGWLELRRSAVVNHELVVFATPDRTLALTFMGGKWTDNDLNLGYINGQLTLEEKWTGAFAKIYAQRTGYLYLVAADGFRQDRRLGMYAHEWVADKAVKIQSVQVISDVWQELLDAQQRGQIHLISAF